jgi:hypothetical protein
MGVIAADRCGIETLKRQQHAIVLSGTVDNVFGPGCSSISSER